MEDKIKQDAFDYHSKGRPGKIEVVSTKPYSTQRDLSLAYTPGVAYPCLEIEKNPDEAYKYTAKGNLVAVITNGTAVLGLGDIGTLAGKPVMEGKGLLFKIFADIDVFDIEVDTHDVEKFIETCKLIAPTFGGINLEDIKAPECFEIEDRLKKELDIPVMHDDQHGTAIITSAGLLNALEINGKKIENIRIVVNGAGASGISCSRLYIALGVKPENITMLDSKGVLRKDRDDLNEAKRKFAIDTKLKTLEEAIVDADMFLGLSVGGVMKPHMLKTMAKDPIVFACANPFPEITYEDAVNTRDDVIMGTGRSDFPNQVNNVLGFPFIFRGALDVKSSDINDEMKLAAAKAMAELAKQPVPEIVNKAYNTRNLVFGKDYIIPKPLDPRLIETVPIAVAKAAIKSGVARKPITDWDAYKEELNRRLGHDNRLMKVIHNKAKSDPKKVVFGDANYYEVLKAAQIVKDEGIAHPILLGDKEKIEKIIADASLDLSGIEIINPRSIEVTEKRKQYAEYLHNKRRRKGLTYAEAYEKMHNRNYFGPMMVEIGEADSFISGFTSKYGETIKPALQIVGTKPGINHFAGLYILFTKKGPFFFADTTVNIMPSPETLVATTRTTVDAVKRFNVDPVAAMVSYSNFGSVKEGSPERTRKAIEILHRDYPEILIDGEMQANFALNTELRKKRFPFSKLGDRDVNTLIFPNLSSGNIAYKIMMEIGGAEAIGPILMGTNKSIHILQIESSVREIVNMTAIAVVDAQCIQANECV